MAPYVFKSRSSIANRFDPKPEMLICENWSYFDWRLSSVDSWRRETAGYLSSDMLSLRLMTSISVWMCNLIKGFLLQAGSRVKSVRGY